MAKMCRSCCAPAPCGPVCVPTQVCPSTPTSGILVTLKDAGGATVGSVTSSGQVATIARSAAGSNYTSAPTVTIDPPPAGGTQATATATINALGKTVTGFTLTNPGGGYLVTPGVTVTGGGGTGAAATLTMIYKSCFASVPGAGTYAATLSLSGYDTKTSNVTVSTCTTPTTTATIILNRLNAVPTTVHGSDSLYGPIAWGALASGVASGSVQPTGNCQTCQPLVTPTMASELYQIGYTLTVGTCTSQLQVGWTVCSQQQSPPIALPVRLADVTGANASQQMTGTFYTLNPTRTSSSPFSQTYTIPPDPRTDPRFGVPLPYAAGATITLTS